MGEAIGKPYLKWGVISTKQLQNGMIKTGISASIAKAFTEMNANASLITEDYLHNRPVLGKTKFKEYAKEFSKAYHQR